MTKENLLNAITSIPSKSKDLERRFSIAGTTIRSMIHDLRKEGHHICSGKEGYWIESDPKKFIDNVDRQILSRVKSLLDVRNKAVEKAQKEFNYELDLLQIVSK